MADAMVHGGAPMLDIARGDGHLIALLVPGTSLVGADWSPAELDGARRLLPIAPPEDAVTRWSAVRDAWRTVTLRYPVVIPPLQDNRALRGDELAGILGDAGFVSLTIEHSRCRRPSALPRPKGRFSSPISPSCSPPEGHAQLEEALECSLIELALTTAPRRL
jgi:hypothetical protein